MSGDLLVGALRASLMLLIGGVGVLLMTRIVPLSSPRWQRMAWGAVLLQGLIWWPWSVHVPAPSWLPGTQFAPASNSEAATGRATVRWFAPRSALSTKTIMQSGPLGGVESHGVDAKLPGPTVDANETPDTAGLAILLEPSDRSADGHSEVEVAAASSPPRPNQLRGTEESARDGGSPDRDVLKEASHDLLIHAWAWPIAFRDWRPVLTAIWLTGGVVLLVLGLAQYSLLQWALARCRPARQVWSRELQELLRELKLEQRVSLDLHPAIGPLICWTPGCYRIVVPGRLWSKLSAVERLAVLHHELSHLRRHDLWKSLVARGILIVHWFNPLAWISARRFDEAAEWACDELTVRERPERASALASALLAAAAARDRRSLLAMAATGGTLFQRIRRLLVFTEQGDSLVRRLSWASLLLAMLACCCVQVRWTLPALAQSAENKAGADAASGGSASTLKEAQLPSEPGAADGSSDGGFLTRLNEFTSRIVAGENETLREFLALLKTPVGRIVMADRAALMAQNVGPEGDVNSRWQRFVATYFKQDGSRIPLPSGQDDPLARMIEEVNQGEADQQQISPVFQEVAGQLNASGELAQLLQRFLRHEAAPAYLYLNELRARLHPEIDDLGGDLAEHLVRTREGRYVIRPARRAMVDARLRSLEAARPILQRFRQELTAWSADIANVDERHQRIRSLLAQEAFADWLASEVLAYSDITADEQLDGVFATLEEATREAPAGLVLETDSEQLTALEADIERYQGLRKAPNALARPRKELLEKLEVRDELHRRLKQFLETNLAWMIIARQMEYAPLTADQLAREWLAQLVTADEQGKYQITTESPDDFRSQLEDFFQGFRELRRFGRTVDDFAATVKAPPFRQAVRTTTGKLLLRELVDEAAVPQDVDGLQLWFDQYFEETAAGLELRDWAGDEIGSILTEAQELEQQLSKSDF